MTSALLASRNDSTWAPMGKTTYSNSHMGANPSPNTKKKQKQFHETAPNAARYQQPHPHNNFDSPAVTQAASDDAYSFNQPSTSRNAGNYGGYLTFEVSSYTKSELISLRKRLLAELDQVREFRSRIETGGLEISVSTKSKVKSKSAGKNTKYVAAVGSVPKKLYDPRSPDAVNFVDLMKDCSKIVLKLIKHKHGHVFREPVNVVAWGLHDYHMIVKRPMDLGTVRTNLSKGAYSTPGEFAADIRLTFNNAMLYNSKGDPVHVMAEQLLFRFEELFTPIQTKMDMQMSRRKEEFCEYVENGELQVRTIEQLQGSSWNNRNQVVSSPQRAKKVKPKSSPVDQVFKKLDRIPVAMQAHSSASTPSNPPPPAGNQQQLIKEVPPSPLRVNEQKMGRGAPVKLPKPKAKDTNKRDMSMEEKQRLGVGLQSLPQEKMPQLIQIIKKRNEHLAQDGDEIELDIEALDTETLWELDRFVTNWKKFVSKTKRQALMMNSNLDAGSAPPPPENEHDVDDVMIDKDKDTTTNVRENEDEDVDIDDDTPAASFPPVDIEKDEGAGGGGGGSISSSGSSSSGSSSSNSDSGSSSGSESDGDDAQS